MVVTDPVIKYLVVEQGVKKSPIDASGSVFSRFRAAKRALAAPHNFVGVADEDEHAADEEEAAAAAAAAAAVARFLHYSSRTMCVPHVYPALTGPDTTVFVKPFTHRRCRLKNCMHRVRVFLHSTSVRPPF